MHLKNLSWTFCFILSALISICRRTHFGCAFFYFISDSTLSKKLTCINFLLIVDNVEWFTSYLSESSIGPTWHRRCHFHGKSRYRSVKYFVKWNSDFFRFCISNFGLKYKMWNLNYILLEFAGRTRNNVRRKRIFHVHFVWGYETFSFVKAVFNQKLSSAVLRSFLK